MTEEYPEETLEEVAVNQPVFNVPFVVLALIGSFIAVHLIRQMVSLADDEWILLHFAFSPGRFEFVDQFPGGMPAAIWSFVTHMFLHGSWEHLLLNSVWLLAFGSVVARRFGWIRFLLFTFVTGALGAAGNLVAYWGEINLMIGASGAISGHMAGAIRLMFSAPGGLANMQARSFSHIQVLPLGQLLKVRSAVIFIGIWLVLNLVFGLSGFGTGGGIGRVAWEAHLGGFLGGLFLFSLFDRRKA